MTQHAKKVIHNTAFLYGKLIFSAAVTLYSTRLLLNSLGIADFGIYNLIAGVILMLTFINGAMTITTQRYLSFHLGGGDLQQLNKIFNSSVSIHFLISMGIVLLLESLSFWLLHGFLHIPADRISDAAWCYHLMVISTFFTINAVPYDALINAKEDMRFDAIIGMAESLLKFVAAYSIAFFDSHKLIVYSTGVVITTILIRVVKSLWCRLKYRESALSFRWLKEGYLFREMLSYASWNLFGSICYVASSQGIAIVLNRFLGVGINGTYAIAQQMNAQLQSFSVIIGKALNPQIVKSEGFGDRPRMTRLALLSSKSSTFLLLFIVVPLVAEMNGVLTIWLAQVPPQAAVFCTIILVNALINQLSTGIKSAVQATGNIKLYQSVVGTTVMLIVPIAYLLLHLGASVFHVLLASTAMEIISLSLRLSICRRISGISYARFLNDVLAKVILVAVLPILTVIIWQSTVAFSIFRMVGTVVLHTLVLLTSIYLVGMTSNEKTWVTMAIKKIKGKKIKLSV
ncbi:hypothetical protein [Sphingobacterium suaedae]|uniref:Lipopolysaccharide biosynthesis protein n=1 Tax=Sphingobacterium suaedae TaxID=1686402 RepID=A0ABW5KMA7_9SPHI